MSDQSKVQPIHPPTHNLPEPTDRLGRWSVLVEFTWPAVPADLEKVFHDDSDADFDRKAALKFRDFLQLAIDVAARGLRSGALEDGSIAPGCDIDPAQIHFTILREPGSRRIAKRVDA